MKIVILSDWYSEKMGYAENHLPSALGALGHEVHLVTTDLQVYATSPDYDTVYGRHLGPRQVVTGRIHHKNYTLHRNPHAIRGGIEILNLAETLRAIRPDVVYCFEILTPTTMQAVQYQRELGYRIFCESRLHLSVYSPPRTIRQRIRNFSVVIRGRRLSSHVRKFYPIAPDVLQVITRYCGIPRGKCKLASLAVDTDSFHPATDPTAVAAFRQSLNYKETDIVCLYTGRFTASKGPEILSGAIRWLQENGHTEFKGLFVGQGDDVAQHSIASTAGCHVHPFVETRELPLFYQAFDIGVWPLQESTSQLDAAACGMPIIINEKVQDTERIKGNGLQYKAPDSLDLARQILKLQSGDQRRQMGIIGSKKVADKFSWMATALDREIDFNIE